MRHPIFAMVPIAASALSFAPPCLTHCRRVSAPPAPPFQMIAALFVFDIVHNSLTLSSVISPRVPLLIREIQHALLDHHYDDTNSRQPTTSNKPPPNRDAVQSRPDQDVHVRQLSRAQGRIRDFLG
mmetsp:Transcript_30032/g.54436  ORF Transcript_30032/g.54436 Transcript_30032/m.54436 type:complete len:126 (-) Transcript_30032:258-635(-)